MRLSVLNQGMIYVAVITVPRESSAVFGGTHYWQVMMG